MYRFKATSAARKRARSLSKVTGVPPQHILMESRSSADRQVGVGDVEQWYTYKFASQRKKKAPCTITPQFGGCHCGSIYDYPTVEAWGKYMQSCSSYIATQLMEARHDRAPPLAIYKRRGRWIELSEVSSPPAVQYFREHYPEIANLAWGNSNDTQASG